MPTTRQLTNQRSMNTLFFKVIKSHLYREACGNIEYNGRNNKRQGALQIQ